MNNAYKYQLIIALLLLANISMAKEGIKPVPATTNQFIKNSGQVTDQHGKLRTDIDFKIENGGVTMFGSSGQLHYQWTKQSQKSDVKSQKDGAHNSRSLAEDRGEVSIYRMDVTLVGANPNALAIFEEPTGYNESYYLAHTGENGVAVKGYGKVTYRSVYPNIDFILYVNPKSEIPNPNTSSTVKYDFVVHPGGNPADIRLRYDGATELKLADGALVAVTPYGTITEDAPYSYNAATKAEVTSKYILQGNELRFDIGQYEGTLVIDPNLVWSTYVSGNYTEHLEDVCSDLVGNVYATGRTGSSANIATTGAHKTTLSGQDDVYLAKFDSLGQRKWATYYGGNDQEMPYSIVTDKKGNLYVTGMTKSNSGIATSGTFQSVYKDSGEIFLTRFDTNGQRIWGTYFGDSYNDYGSGVVCDETGNVYISGFTFGSANMATTGAHKTFVSGGDGIVAKFNASGQRVWATYYGGTGLDLFEEITLSNDSYLYVTGQTASASGITTAGMHQVSFSGWHDAMLVKFDTSGQRVWGTYYGGSGDEQTDCVHASHDGYIYIVGQTSSSSNIASTGAHQTVYAGNYDIFLAKFSASGVRQWGTYFGGYAFDHAENIHTFNNKVYVFGSTASPWMATFDAHQANFQGTTDGMLCVFLTNGTLDYASYFGGTHSDFFLGSTCTYTGMLYGAGHTQSSTGIATTGAYQTTYGGWMTGFLNLWRMKEPVAYIRHPYVDTTWCPGDTVRIVYGVNQNFSAVNQFKIQLSNATGSFTNAVNIGTHADSFSDTVTCVIPINTPAGTGYRIRIVADSPGYVGLDNQINIRVRAAPQAFSNTTIGSVCAEDTMRLTSATTSTSVTWGWTGPNSFAATAKDTFIANSATTHTGDYILKATLTSTGCSLYDTTTVTVKARPDKPIAGSNSPVCEFYSLQLTTGSATSGVTYAWTGPNGYSNNTQNPTITNSAGSIHAGDYISTATLNGCSRKDTVTAIVYPKPAKPTAAAPNSPLCARQNLQLTASAVSGASYNWYGAAGFTATTQNPTRNNIQLGEAGKYYVYATVNGCISDTDSVAVIVNTDPVVNIFPTPAGAICPGQQVIFTAIPTNGGVTGYQWYVNGMATGVTTLAYTTTTLNNNDKVYCLMVSTGTCATPFTDTSNEITMTVKQALAPKVVISADAGPSLFPNEPINFTAVHTDAGNAPTFQWKRNGQNVGGANGQVWGANANFLSDGDDICVLIKSSYDCPSPDSALSNCIKLDIRLSVDDIANSNSIKVYPNPVSGTLHITSTTTIETITINNLLGQQLLQQTATGKTAVIDMSALAAGVYVVKVNGVYAVRVTKE